MKRVMVMGAAIEQLPGIIAAKEMGYRVGVIDYNPLAVGIPYADEYFNVSTIDEDGVYKAAKQFGADGFLTLATDMPMRAVARACERLHLTGINYETSIKATDKGKMIQALSEHDVAIPWYRVINSRKEFERVKSQISYPCILKPIDNAASRGVVLVKSIDDLEKAYLYSLDESREKKVIIEEYMTGSEVSVETLSVDGITYVLQVTDKLTTGAPHFVEIGHNQPSSLPEKIRHEVEMLAVKAVSALGIHVGPAHVEIMVTNNGPKIIELGARLGGDCITSHLVRLSTGVDMLKETIRTLCGEHPIITKQFSKGAAIRFLTTEQKGIFESLSGETFAENVPGVVEIGHILKKGDKLSGVHSSDDRIAYVIASGETIENAVSACDSALSKLCINVKKEQ